MPGGRPTKYTDELLEKAWWYVNGGWEEVGDAIPSHVGLFIELNISNTCGYDWAQDPEKEFSDILGQIMLRQERVLFNKTLKGDYNATIAKLALGKHGYHDKADTTLAAPGGGPVQVQEITFNPVGPND